MSFKFNYFQVTLEKQESQRTETSKQSTKKWRTCCSTGMSETIQGKGDLDCGGQSGEVRWKVKWTPLFRAPRNSRQLTPVPACTTVPWKWDTHILWPCVPGHCKVYNGWNQKGQWFFSLKEAFQSLKESSVPEKNVSTELKVDHRVSPCVSPLGKIQ